MNDQDSGSEIQVTLTDKFPYGSGYMNFFSITEKKKNESHKQEHLQTHC